MKHGKKYSETAKLVDSATQYETADAIALVKKTAVAKFDETIEVHIRTGCDGRHAEQQIRGAVVLPNGTGKTVRVLVFAKGDKSNFPVSDDILEYFGNDKGRISDKSYWYKFLDLEMPDNEEKKISQVL